jgi:hypothetical protein
MEQNNEVGDLKQAETCDFKDGKIHPDYAFLKNTIEFLYTVLYRLMSHILQFSRILL